VLSGRSDKYPLGQETADIWPSGRAVAMAVAVASDKNAPTTYATARRRPLARPSRFLSGST